MRSFTLHVVTILSCKFRLYPNRIQQDALDAMLGAFCDLYNAGLDQRIQAYRRRGVTLRYGQQASELKAVRAEDERLAGFSFSAEQQVLRRLDKAFAAFFRRVKSGQTPGFPRFRAKTRFDSAEFRVGDGLTVRKTERLGIVGIPGEIKAKWHRPLPADAKLGAAVVSRSCGKWYVCMGIALAMPDQIETPDPEPAAREFAAVGVDLGLSNLVALSTGETVTAPKHAIRAAKALRPVALRRHHSVGSPSAMAQRALARKSRGSRRRLKAKLRVARLHARVANQRRDFSHKLSRSLADGFTHIAFEDLNTKGLARGMLARSVHDAAWAQLVRHTTYKAAWAGGVVGLVEPRGTSQTCPKCGTVAAKTLKGRVHRCGCGCTLDRDVAAARVVLHRANFGPGHGLRAPSRRVAA